MNNRGDEYSDSRLEKKAISLTNYSAQDILNKINSDVSEFCEGAPQSDDITMLAVCRLS